MKKILLFISTLVIGLSNTNAQTSIEIYNSSAGGYIVNNDVLTEDVSAGNTSHNYIAIKNVSGSTKVYGFKRTDVVLNSGAAAYFCFAGTCYVPAVTNSPNTVTLTATQQDASTQLYYDEDATTEGYSEIKYEVYDVNNPTDKVTFTYKYNPLLLSVKNITTLFSSVSDVYPNPSANKAQISLTSSTAVNGAKVSITNALGTVVSVKTVELSTGKNTVVLDAENLSSGIYFATISLGNTKVVKKFTINK